MSEALSVNAANFMARYFSMGPASQIISHEPHATLNKHRTAFEECLAAGLVRQEAFNTHGSVRINSTEQGLVVAQEAFRRLASDLLSESVSGRSPEGVETLGSIHEHAAPQSGETPVPSLPSHKEGGAR